MGRFIGLDYGTKRVGIAVTDTLRMIANPMDTVGPGEVIGFLKKYMETEAVDAFIIGEPRQMNNQPSESVKYIDLFVKKLRKSFPGIPVFRVDERFTSKMAYRAIAGAGLKKKDKHSKELVDKVSAAIILQTFLEMETNREKI